MKSINKTIEKALKGLDSNAYQSLLSFYPFLKLDPVYAAGILAEIGSVDAFKSQDALANYTGLIWCENRFGNFRIDSISLKSCGIFMIPNNLTLHSGNSEIFSYLVVQKYCLTLEE